LSESDKNVRSRLERFLAGDLSLEDFESWLYANAESVEGTLGSALGFELLSFDFRGKYANHELKQLIDRIYASLYPNELPVDHARRVAAEYLQGTRDLHSTMRILASIRFDAPEGWIPDEVVYIDSELDNIPAPEQEPHWLRAAWTRLMSQKAPLMNEYARVAREVCADLLVKPAMSQKREA
jgi:hypothetical protein